MADDKVKDLDQLYKAFKAFGETIGRDNLAVWFWKHKYLPGRKLDDVDLGRSTDFCSRAHLVPSRGPFIVVTSTYPEQESLGGELPKNSALFELGAMKPSEVSDLLAHLADQLVANRLPSQATATSPQPAAPLSWDVRLLGAVQQLLNRLGCAWTFKIETEGVKAELQSCSKASSPK